MIPFDGCVSPAASPARPRSRFELARRVVLLLLLFTGGVAVWRLWDQNLLSSGGMLALAQGHPVLAPALFVLAYAVAMFFLIPTLPLNLGAGFLWGGLLGAVYTVLGTTLGGCCAFLVARTTLGRPLAGHFRFRMGRRLVRAVSESGWKVMAFIRLNPLAPTGMVNFILGLTALDFGIFTWGTLLFSFPLAYLVACLGGSAGGFLLTGDSWSLLRALGLTLGVGLFMLAGWRLSREPGDAEPGDARPPAPPSPGA